MATLPPNPKNGPFYRLDDMLDRAVVKQEPPAGRRRQCVGRRARVRRSGCTGPEGRPRAGPRPRMRDGVLEVVNDPDDYLENAVAAGRAARRDRRSRDPHEGGQGHLSAPRLDQRRRAQRRQDLAGQARRPLHRHQGLPHLRHQCARRDAARSAARARISPASTSSRPMSRAPRSSWTTSGSSPRRRAMPPASRGVDYESHRRRDAPRHVHAAGPGARVRAQGPRAAAKARFRHGRAARRPAAAVRGPPDAGRTARVVPLHDETIADTRNGATPASI